MKLRRCIVALGMLVMVATLHAQAVSFTDLAKHPEYRDVKISPDGQYLAATAVVKNQTVLALIHLTDMKIKVLSPRGTDDVADFWWASPDHVIYTVGTREGGYASPLATGELFGVKADGSDPKLFYGYRRNGMGTAEFIASIPDDPHHVLISIGTWAAEGIDGGFPHVYLMDLRGGWMMKDVISAPARRMTFVADHHGHVRLAYGDDVNGSPKVYMHPVGGGSWRELQQAESGRCFPATFTKDDHLVYFTCSALDGKPAVRSWDPAKDAWATVWNNPKVEADSLIYGMADDDIIGVGFSDGRPGAALFDGESPDAKALVMLMKQFPGENVRFVSGTRDGHLSVLLVESDVNPGTFYLYDRQANKLTLLLTRTPWIDPQRMASKRPIELAARDGMQLHGYVSFPPGMENAKHLPTVVYVHGGPYGVRDFWGYDSDVQALATHGYAVLQVNFRGSGGYGYSFMRAGWGEWGGKMACIINHWDWRAGTNIAD